MTTPQVSASLAVPTTHEYATPYDPPPVSRAFPAVRTAVRSLSGAGASPTSARRTASPIPPTAKWGWALRYIPEGSVALETGPSAEPPKPGDVGVFRVDRLGYHTSVVVRDGRKLRIYPEDVVVGVFGNRYATDGFEAEVDGVGELALLTAAAMVGTVRSAHRDMGRSTKVTLLGYLVDADGRRTNTKRHRFAPERAPLSGHAPVLVVIGTGMNAGKTTVVSQVVHDLSAQGLRVAAGKITGSVSNRDADEMRAASAVSVIDFSDYGFPSTYLADGHELTALWQTILAASARVRPDLIVLEIADGILERETAMLLADPGFGSHVSGYVLAADSPLAAYAASEHVLREGLPLLAVSGALTSSPLGVREYRALGRVPVFPSASEDPALANHVAERLAIPSLPAAVGTDLTSVSAPVADWAVPP